MKPIATLACLVLVLVGCGSTGTVRLGSTTARPKGPACPIAILASESDAKGPFEKVCMLDAKTGSTLFHDKSPDGAMKRLTAAACACGADAILLTGVEKTGVNLLTWGSSETKGIAIRYTTPTASAK